MNRILVHPTDNFYLRQTAKKVKNPQATDVVLAVQTMKKLALEWEQKNPGDACAGLAATQIGVPLRIIIVRRMEMPLAPQNPNALTSEQLDKLYGTGFEGQLAFATAALKYKNWLKTEGASYDPFITMYNPVYVSTEGEPMDSEEGCLSVPYAHGMTLRPEKCTFHFYDQNLKRQPKAGEFQAAYDPSLPVNPAAVICHELDHLKGVLFIDSAFKTWRPGSKEEFLAKKEEAEKNVEEIESILEEEDKEVIEEAV